MKNAECKMKNQRGFSLVELLIVIVIIGVLSVVAYTAIEKSRTKAMNDKVMDDLAIIANSLEDYRRDHDMKYPVPEPTPQTNQNILCYYADATYAHDCATAVFRQGMIDNNLLTRRYLREVPSDPHTGTRYAYGVTNDGKYFQVAGIYKLEDGNYQARAIDNLAKGFELPSVIRAFDSQNFVVDKDKFLPYSPDFLVLIGTIRNVTGIVSVNSTVVGEGYVVRKGDTISTDATGSADIYFSDGSITHLNSGSNITLVKMEVAKNDKDGTFTGILMQLNVGKIWSKVVRLASKSSFDVKTTGAIAGVRGTECGFSVDSLGNLIQVQCISGSVDVKTLEGAEIASLVVPPAIPATDTTPAVPSVPKQLSLGSVGGPAYVTDIPPSEVQVINSAYYQSIPLSSIVRPYIISAKYEDGKGKVTIRNINYFADIVNEELGLTDEKARTIKADKLSAYVLNGDGHQELIDTISIMNADPLQSYTIEGDAYLNKSLVFRFENWSNIGEIISSSSFSVPPVTITDGTDLSESDLYPNLPATQHNELALNITGPSYFGLAKDTTGKFIPSDIIPAIKVDVINASAFFAPAVTALDDSGAVCEAVPVLDQNDPKVFYVNVNAKNIGNCALDISVTSGTKTVSNIHTITIVPQSDKLVLLKPLDNTSVPAGTVDFSWVAPGGGVKFAFKLDTSGSLNPQTSTSITIPVETAGSHTWTVTSYDVNNQPIDTKTGNFRVLPNVNANFYIKKTDALGTHLLDLNQSQLTLTYDSSQQMQVRLYADTTGVPSTAKYDWTFNNLSFYCLNSKYTLATTTVPPKCDSIDPLDKQQDIIVNVDTTGLPGSPVIASATLTVRDSSGISLGAPKAKTITVMSAPTFGEIYPNTSLQLSTISGPTAWSYTIPTDIFKDDTGYPLGESCSYSISQSSGISVSSGTITSIYPCTSPSGCDYTITCTLNPSVPPLVINGKTVTSQKSATKSLRVNKGVLSPFCGDGEINGTDVCDDGPSNGQYSKCKTDCSGIGSHCGDGVVNTPDETCDGTNFIGGNIPSCPSDKSYGSVTCYESTNVNACTINTSGCKSFATFCMEKGGYWDGSNCWIKGDTNASCTAACSAIKDQTGKSLSCVDTPDAGWSLTDNAICPGLNGTMSSLLSLLVQAPYIANGQCINRNTTKTANQTCTSVGPIGPASINRICMCK